METYLWGFCAVFLVFALFGKWYCKNWMNPITMFCGIWTCVLLFYSFHFWGLYKASELSVTICIVGVFSFFFGSFLRAIQYRSFKPSISIQNRLIVKKNDINYNVLNILNIISLIVLLRFALLTVQLLASGKGFDYIRDMYMDEDGGSLGSSKLLGYIMSFFLWPWNYVLIPLTVIVFLNDKKKSKSRTLFILTSLANIVGFILVTAGRISMVYCIMYFVILKFLMGKRSQLTKKQKIAIVILLVGIVAGISIISASRGSPEFIRNAYVYLCGCMPFFSNRLKIYFAESGIQTLGFASMRGVWMIVLIPLSKVLGFYPDLYTEAVKNIYVQDRIFIGPHQGYNAFTSLFYFFYIDGGMIGVILFSALYGYCAMASYIKLQKKTNYENLVVYCLVSFGLIFSMVRFQFVTIRYVGAFIYVWLCFHALKMRIKIKSH